MRLRSRFLSVATYLVSVSGVSATTPTLTKLPRSRLARATGGRRLLIGCLRVVYQGPSLGTDDLRQTIRGQPGSAIWTIFHLHPHSSKRESARRSALMARPSLSTSASVSDASLLTSTRERVTQRIGQCL